MHCLMQVVQNYIQEVTERNNSNELLLGIKNKQSMHTNNNNVSILI